MRQRDWIVIGVAVAIMVAGIGIGLAIRHGRATQRQKPAVAGPPHHQRSQQAEQVAAQRAEVARQKRAEALRRYDKMTPDQQRQWVADQVHPREDPNATPRQVLLAADQNEVARQIVEKLRGVPPDQRRQYLRRLLEQERARLATSQGGDPNRGAADVNSPLVVPAPAEGNAPSPAATGP